MEVAKIAGPDLDFSDTPISVAAENVLFLRHVELRGQLRRIISILKMRESGYDPHVREFVIAEDGIRVLEPLRGEGLLTGIPRFVEDGGGVNEYSRPTPAGRERRLGSLTTRWIGRSRPPSPPGAG